MVPLLAYIHFERRGVPLAPGKHKYPFEIFVRTLEFVKEEFLSIKGRNRLGHGHCPKKKDLEPYGEVGRRIRKALSDKA